MADLGRIKAVPFETIDFLMVASFIFVSVPGLDDTGPGLL